MRYIFHALKKVPSKPSHVQFPKMNVRRLLSYEAKLLFSEGHGRMETCSHPLLKTAILLHTEANWRFILVIAVAVLLHKTANASHSFSGTVT